FRRIPRRRRRPMRVMVLISVLLISLGNDPAGLLLDLALLEHQGVLWPPPVLDGRKPKPRRSAVLILAVHRVAGGQVFIWIPALNQDARRMHPLLVAEAIHVVPEV